RARSHQPLEAGGGILRGEDRLLVGAHPRDLVAAAIDVDDRRKHVVPLGRLEHARLAVHQADDRAVRGAEVDSDMHQPCSPCASALAMTILPRATIRPSWTIVGSIVSATTRRSSPANSSRLTGSAGSCGPNGCRSKLTALTPSAASACSTRSRP